MAGKKIIKIDGGKKSNNTKVTDEIILNEEELALKAEFDALDNKIQSIYKVISTITPQNEDSLIVEDVLSNIVGITAVSAATTIIGKFLGVDEDTLKNLI